MKKTLLIAAFLGCAVSLPAQESQSLYNILKLPVSAHATALGGKNISLAEDDATLIFQNPALLGNVSNRTLGLNYMTYPGDCKVGSASYSFFANDRSSVSVAAQLMDYGSMMEADASGIVSGTFSAKDIVLSGTYSYELSDYFLGGVTLRGIYSKYAEYSAFSVGVDLGLNYYDADTDLSVSLVAQNLGGQLKAFADKRYKLPTDFQLGFTKRLEQAPIRFSVTMTDLFHWKSSYFYYVPNVTEGEEDAEETKVSFGKRLINHFNVGVEFLPSDNIWIAAGYNFRRAYEMKVLGKSHGAGWSFGGGLIVKRFKLGISYAKLHISNASLLYNIAYSF
jgi:long-subunit fatty acid transport protein